MLLALALQISILVSGDLDLMNWPSNSCQGAKSLVWLRPRRISPVAVVGFVEWAASSGLTVFDNCTPFPICFSSELGLETRGVCVLLDGVWKMCLNA